jgi:hypothetical protein
MADRSDPKEIRMRATLLVAAYVGIGAFMGCATGILLLPLAEVASPLFSGAGAAAGAAVGVLMNATSS